MAAHPPLVEELSFRKREKTPTYQEKLYNPNPKREWSRIIELLGWEHLIEVSDPKKEKGKLFHRLHTLVSNYDDKFEFDSGPVEEKIVENHFKDHFKKIDSLVRGDVIKPAVAIRAAELVYIYDSVLPNLGESIITPNFPAKRMKILLVPSPLHDWMYEADLFWAKLTNKNELDLKNLKHLHNTKENFIEKSKELMVYSPVPPLEETPEIKSEDIRKKWFRGEPVKPTEINEYLYRKYSNREEY